MREISSKFFQSFPQRPKENKGGMARLLPVRQQRSCELRCEFLKLMAQEIDFSARVLWAVRYRRSISRGQRTTTTYADPCPIYSNTPEDRSADSRRSRERGSSTSNLNLQHAVTSRNSAAVAMVTHELRNTTKFNVQPYDHEILAGADYSLWTVQRVYEKGDESSSGLN